MAKTPTPAKAAFPASLFVPRTAVRPQRACTGSTRINSIKGKIPPRTLAPHPRTTLIEQNRPGPFQRGRAEEKIQIADRSRNQAAQKPTEQEAGQPPQNPADGPQKKNLGKKGPDDLPAAGPHASQNARIFHPAHHREHGRVVYEEYPDEEGQKREGLEVQAEGPQHITHGRLPLPPGLDAESGFPSGKKIRFIAHDKVNPIDFSGKSEKPLGVAYVHKDYGLARGIWERTDDLEASPGCLKELTGVQPRLRG